MNSSADKQKVGKHFEREVRRFIEHSALGNGKEDENVDWKSSQTIFFPTTIEREENNQLNKQKVYK